jgi:hypothetical protein
MCDRYPTHGRFWHEAPFRYGAKVQTLLEVKRTCWERREHLDPTTMIKAAVCSRPIASRQAPGYETAPEPFLAQPSALEPKCRSIQPS